MWISTTEAVARLADIHLLGENQAKRVLRAGLAGAPHRAGSANFYDAEQFEKLLARPRCAQQTLDRWQPFIARVGRQRPIDLDAPWEEQAVVMAPAWHLPLLTAFRIDARKPVPFVATLGAWAVFTADLVGLDRADLRLEPPGKWAAEFTDTWLPIGNGPVWTLWGAPVTTPLRADPLSANYQAEAADERRRRKMASVGHLRSLTRE
ncbi:hypothetical protein J2S40_002211 [Nocardioides luteus]|uniref:Uncharacterized protein n=1 Tax=Nocardioides luteus TaxID=1844 RepID=A0ABQ5SS06_9ACTN|nr:hypothetical protein [Nocardioides luteus]MDR7311153.1 hypothetical protein [Nocardioides luteus]GGR62637.1 hypothetical protein GCM10010197_32410 [Nocardioides luteus]GLJ66699.1 hypothetical protein GCM10017579_07350 [Nocardioides luteus]